jgi:hypothetical protein
VCRAELGVAKLFYKPDKAARCAPAIFPHNTVGHPKMWKILTLPTTKPRAPVGVTPVVGKIGYGSCVNMHVLYVDIYLSVRNRLQKYVKFSTRQQFYIIKLVEC